MSILPIGRALVLDRNSTHLFFAAEALKALGVAEVEPFVGAEAAVKKWGEGGFDLALFDIETGWSGISPGSGPTLFVGMHAKVIGADTRAVFKALGDGVDALLEKPFTKLMLLRKLEDALCGPAGRRLKVVELRRPSHRATLFGVPRFGHARRSLDPI